MILIPRDMIPILMYVCSHLLRKVQGVEFDRPYNSGSKCDLCNNQISTYFFVETGYIFNCCFSINRRPVIYVFYLLRRMRQENEMLTILLLK
jgi:hypothetical protein